MEKRKMAVGLQALLPQVQSHIEDENEGELAWRRYSPLAPWGDQISLLFLLSSQGFIHVSPSYRLVILCTNHLLQGVSPLLIALDNRTNIRQ